jgi:hypothetical protein
VVGLTTALGAPASAGVRSSRLPPPDRASIAAQFDPVLVPLGLHISRAGLEDLSSYRASSKGRRLAVYVQPTGAYTDADYVRNITTVARVFLPAVFQRWRGLETLDVCQEPLASVDPRPEAPPVTQLLVSRRASVTVRWASVTLAGVIRASNHRRGSAQLDLHLYVNGTIRTRADYLSAGGRPTG